MRLARGRMYLKARLGWLSGFPLRQSPGEVIWLPLPMIIFPDMYLHRSCALDNLP